MDEEYKRLFGFLIEKINKEKKYTGYTSRCRFCKEEIKLKNIGMDESNNPIYLLSCGCK